MKEALLYERLEGNTVRCGVCQARCVIRDGTRGHCDTRVNQGGVLYSLLYGLAASACVDPIEKKPLYHFFPGTAVFSLGTVGCNFRCPGCQNYSLSRAKPDNGAAGLHRLSPEKSLELAVRYGCAGICWTYNEPAVWFEQTLETARLARERGLYTC
ncbi:MAG: AmmeMemoRadiSam system radical SAM enzyme, partial [Armatimonadota bacterium]|nr:AmmeMemoRadiSam system radical SAM enzyme [Armatimonadota bacterium]